MYGKPWIRFRRAWFAETISSEFQKIRDEIMELTEDFKRLDTQLTEIDFLVKFGFLQTGPVS